MPLTKCEINLNLFWSQDCVISSATGETKLAVTNSGLNVPVVTLSTQDNVKLLKELDQILKEKLTGININRS